MQTLHIISVRVLLIAVSLLAVAASADAQTTPFSGCGTIVPGVTCPKLFDADAGGLYVIDADLTSHAIGDRVLVTGDLDPGCFTACNQGDGCIFSAAVSGCSMGPVGTNYCGPAIPNSSGSGAVISGTGTGIAGDPLDLTAGGLPLNQFAYMLASQVQDFVPGAGGSQGALCIGVPAARFNRPGEILTSGNTGSVTLTVDTNDIPLSPPVAVLSGETWNFQCWFRDNNPGATSNFSDGLSVTFL